MYNKFRIVLPGLSELQKEADGPSIIVQSSNPSNVSPLTDAVNGLGKGDDVIITPNQSLPQALGRRESYPIYVTLRPYELKEFIQNWSDEWKVHAEDFVFFSGTKECGVVEPILREFGMCRDDNFLASLHETNLLNPKLVIASTQVG